jgi:hypothetical protein
MSKDDFSATLFLKEDARTNHRFRALPRRAQIQKKLRTNFDSRTGSYSPVNRTMVGAPHTMAENEEHLLDK